MPNNNAVVNIQIKANTKELNQALKQVNNLGKQMNESIKGLNKFYAELGKNIDKAINGVVKSDEKLIAGMEKVLNAHTDINGKLKAIWSDYETFVKARTKAITDYQTNAWKKTDDQVRSLTRAMASAVVSALRRSEKQLTKLGTTAEDANLKIKESAAGIAESAKKMGQQTTSFGRNLEKSLKSIVSRLDEAVKKIEKMAGSAKKSNDSVRESLKKLSKAQTDQSKNAQQQLRDEMKAYKLYSKTAGDLLRGPDPSKTNLRRVIADRKAFNQLIADTSAASRKSAQGTGPLRPMGSSPQKPWTQIPIGTVTQKSWAQYINNEKVAFDIGIKNAELMRIKLGQLKTPLNGLGDSMMSFGKQTQWTGRQIMMAFSLPLFAVARSATQSYLAVSREYTRINKLIGDKQFTSNYSTINRDIAALVTGFGVSQKSAAALTGDLVAMGYDVRVTGKAFRSEAATMGQEIMKTATLGDIGLKSATDFYRTMMKVFVSPMPGVKNFRDEVEGTNFIVDQLNQIENKTAINLNQLADAMPIAASAAKLFGMNAGELASVLTGTYDKGIAVNTAATGLNFTLTRILNPTKKATVLFDQAFGKGALSDLQTMGNGLERLIKLAAMYTELQNRGGPGRNATQATQVITELGSKRQLKTYGPMFAAITTGMDQIRRAVASMPNAAAMLQQKGVDPLTASYQQLIPVMEQYKKQLLDSEIVTDGFARSILASNAWVNKTTPNVKQLAKEFRNMSATEIRIKLKSPTVQYQVLKQTMKMFMADFGKLIFPVIIKFMNVLSKLLMSIDNMAPAVKNLIAGILFVVAALGPAIYIFGTFKTAIGFAIKAVAQFIPGLKIMSKEMVAALTPQELSAANLKQIGDAFIKLEDGQGKLATAFGKIIGLRHEDVAATEAQILSQKELNSLQNNGSQGIVGKIKASLFGRQNNPNDVSPITADLLQRGKTVIAGGGSRKLSAYEQFVQETTPQPIRLTGKRNIGEILASDIRPIRRRGFLKLPDEGDVARATNQPTVNTISRILGRIPGTTQTPRGQYMPGEIEKMQSLGLLARLRHPGGGYRGKARATAADSKKYFDQIVAEYNAKHREWIDLVEKEYGYLFTSEERISEIIASDTGAITKKTMTFRPALQAARQGYMELFHKEISKIASSGGEGAVKAQEILSGIPDTQIVDAIIPPSVHPQISKILRRAIGRPTGSVAGPALSEELSTTVEQMFPGTRAVRNLKPLARLTGSTIMAPTKGVFKAYKRMGQAAIAPFRGLNTATIEEAFSPEELAASAQTRGEELLSHIDTMKKYNGKKVTDKVREKLKTKVTRHMAKAAAGEAHSLGQLTEDFALSPSQALLTEADTKKTAIKRTTLMAQKFKGTGFYKGAAQTFKKDIPGAFRIGLNTVLKQDLEQGVGKSLKAGLANAMGGKGIAGLFSKGGAKGLLSMGGGLLKGGLKGGLAGVVGAEGGIGGLLGGLGSVGAALGPLAAILPIVIAIGAGIFLLVKNWDKVQKAMQPGIKAIKEAFGGLMNAFKGIGKIFGDAIGKLDGSGGEGKKQMSIWTAIGSVFSDVMKIFSQLIKAITWGIKALSPVFRWLATIIANNFGWMMNLIKALAALLQGKGSDAWMYFKKAVGYFLKFVLSISSPIIKVINVIFNAIMKVVATILGLLAKIPFVGKLFKGIANAANSLSKSDFQKGMTNMIDQATGIKPATVLVDFQETKASKHRRNSKATDVKKKDTTPFDGGGGGSSKNAMDSFLSTLKSKLEDLIGKLKDAISKEFDRVWTQRLKAFDDQTKAIDNLEKKEEELLATQEYVQSRREALNKRYLDQENYKRNRALAIYEGRIDDARNMDLEFSVTNMANNKAIRDLDTSRARALLKQERDLARERIAIAKDAAEQWKTAEEEALKAQIDLITQYTPKTDLEWNNMMQTINNTLSQHGIPLIQGTWQDGLTSFRTASDQALADLKDSAFWNGEWVSTSGLYQRLKEITGIDIPGIVSALQAQNAGGGGSGTGGAGGMGDGNGNKPPKPPKPPKGPSLANRVKFRIADLVNSNYSSKKFAEFSPDEIQYMQKQGTYKYYAGLVLASHGPAALQAFKKNTPAQPNPVKLSKPQQQALINLEKDIGRKQVGQSKQLTYIAESKRRIAMPANKNDMQFRKQYLDYIAQGHTDQDYWEEIAPLSRFMPKDTVTKAERKRATIDLHKPIDKQTMKFVNQLSKRKYAGKSKLTPLQYSAISDEVRQYGRPLSESERAFLGKKEISAEQGRIIQKQWDLTHVSTDPNAMAKPGGGAGTRSGHTAKPLGDTSTAEKNATAQGNRVGRAGADGVAKGYLDRHRHIAAALKEGNDKAESDLLRYLRIGSPSKRYADNIGKPIADGIAMGIKAPSSILALKIAFAELLSHFDKYDFTVCLKLHWNLENMGGLASGIKKIVKPILDDLNFDVNPFSALQPYFNNLWNGYKIIMRMLDAVMRPSIKPGEIGPLETRAGGNKPPQLKKGAIIKKRPGGILANIGEGRYDEAVIPLPNGINNFANSFKASRGFGNMKITAPQTSSTAASTAADQSINIYVDNFIGQAQWFESMMSEYGVKIAPNKQRSYGTMNRTVSSYQDNAYRTGKI